MMGTRGRSRVTRCVFEKVAQNVALSIFCENYYTSATVEKIAQLFWLLLQFSQKLPNENSHPIGENSPNLVTLGRSYDPNFLRFLTIFDNFRRKIDVFLKNQCYD
jgi:hypothetical protein